MKILAGAASETKKCLTLSGSKLKFPLQNFQGHEATAALEVCKVLNENQWIAFLAGGCVRDAYVKRPIRDFDIATSAPPEVVENLFSQTKPIGKEFGTILVLQNGIGIEVTTFRSDGGYVDGRHPQAITWVDAEQDALRRDFTINALFYNPESEEILDYVGGISDLNRQILKFVGQPDLRIKEDHLRILRGVRFLIELGFTMEHNTSRAMMDSMSLIKKLSVERIFNEFEKIVKSEKLNRWHLLFDFKVFEVLTGLTLHLVKSPETNANLNPWLVFIHWLNETDSKLADSFLNRYVQSKEIKNLYQNYLKSRSPEFLNQRKGQLFELVFDQHFNQLFLLLIDSKAIEATQFFKQSSGIKPIPRFKAQDFPSIKGSQLGKGLKELYWRQLEGIEDSSEEAAKIFLKFN